MEPLKQGGEIAAVSSYCVIILLWMALLKYMITSHWPGLSCVTCLVLSKWFGQWRQTWGVAPGSVFSMPFCVFIPKIWSFQDLSA